MDNSKREQRKTFLIHIAYWAVILALVYCGLKYFINLIMPFFLAAIMAAVSRPLKKLLSGETGVKRRRKKGQPGPIRRIGLPKNVAAVLSVIILFIIILGLMTALCAYLVNTGAELVAKIPGFYYKNVQPGLIGAFEKVSIWFSGIDESYMEMLNSASSNIISAVGSKVTDLSGKMIVRISSIVTSIPSALLKVIICLIATVFMAVDFDSIKAFIRLTLPDRPWRTLVAFRDSLVDMVWSFLKSYFFIFLITMAEITVGMILVGQKKPLLLGILIAIFDAFPIVGSGMILLPFSVITMLTGKIGKGIGLFFVYLVVVVVRQIIEPKIVGKHVGMRPLVTLICMYVGTKLFGGIGLFAVPILAAILIDMRQKKKTEENARTVKGDEPDAAASEPALPEKDLPEALEQSGRSGGMYHTVLFDLDGTLTESAPGIMKSVEYALKKFGIEETDKERLRLFIGPPLRDSFQKFYGFSEEQCKLGVEYYRECFLAGAMFENAVYDGIPELLQTLRDAGKKLVVATSKPEPQTLQILEHFDLLHYFDFVAGATLDESRCEKADVITYALEQFGITDTESTVMIGDRRNDVEGAAANGLPCIGVLYGYGSREELTEAGARVLAETPEELGRLLLA